MNTSDTLELGARGGVCAYLTKADGDPSLFTDVHNQLSYSAAEAVASAYAGDSSLIPRRIGFVYGTSANPTGLSTGSDREMSWNTLKEQLGGFGNVQIAEFSSPPAVSVNDPSTDPPDSRPSKYGTGNAVTFHACTRSGSGAEYGFSPDGVNHADVLGGQYLYQVLLLGIRPGQECTTEKGYVILGRASLMKGGEYRQKPTDYELAVSWRVSFF